MLRYGAIMSPCRLVHTTVCFSFDVNWYLSHPPHHSPVRISIIAANGRTKRSIREVPCISKTNSIVVKLSKKAIKQIANVCDLRIAQIAIFDPSYNYWRWAGRCFWEWTGSWVEWELAEGKHVSLECFQWLSVLKGGLRSRCVHALHWWLPSYIDSKLRLLTFLSVGLIPCFRQFRMLIGSNDECTWTSGVLDSKRQTSSMDNVETFWDMKQDIGGLPRPVCQPLVDGYLIEYVDKLVAIVRSSRLPR